MPLNPGSFFRYVLLHHVMGQLEGRQGAWGYVTGGMGELSQALARAATMLGAEIFTEKVCSCSRGLTVWWGGAACPESFPEKPAGKGTFESCKRQRLSSPGAVNLAIWRRWDTLPLTCGAGITRSCPLIRMLRPC